MKVACLVGVSNYKSIMDLPGCTNDLYLMKTMLEATGEYDAVHCISGDQESAKTKQQIVASLSQYKGKPVEQVFFYYTGHGNFDGQEFEYLLSDYETSRHKQTVIENTELDDWLRLLDPQLTIKVVDACNAGIQYVKEPEAFEKFLAVAHKSFNCCYFMFSSQANQSSYQDSQLSDFTRSIAESVASFSSGGIRFKDIIDYVSDEFLSNSKQTPYFVTQATQTELFATVTPSLQTAIASAIAKFYALPLSSNKDALGVAAASSLIEVIKADASRYCTEEEAMKQIEHIQEYWSGLEYTGDISALFDFDVQPIPALTANMPKRARIGQWLAENNNEYFAEPTYGYESYTEEVEVPKRSILGAAALALGQTETKTVKRERKIVNGFRLSQDVKVPAMLVTAKSRYENIGWHECYLVYLLSKTEVRFFFLFSALRESNWTDRSPSPESKWRTCVAPLKNTAEIDAALTRIAREFTESIMDPIRAEFASHITEEGVPSGAKTEPSDQ